MRLEGGNIGKTLGNGAWHLGRSKSSCSHHTSDINLLDYLLLEADMGQDFYLLEFCFIGPYWLFCSDLEHFYSLLLWLYDG